MRACVVTGVSHLSAGSGSLDDLAHAPLALKPARLGRMDRLCALALVAADGALADAGMTLPSLAALGADRVGVVVGTRYGCHATNEEYFRGLLVEGPRGASPRLFAYTLPSSPLGELAIHFRARGPSQTLASGRHAGVEAVARASSLCGSSRADLVIAVAVEVGGGALVGAACGDGATALVIEPAEQARTAGRAARARLAGSGMAFVAGAPDQARVLATARAVAEAGLPPRQIAALSLGDDTGATAGPAALIDWLRCAHGEGSLGLLVDGDEAGGAAALLAVATGGARLAAGRAP